MFVSVAILQGSDTAASSSDTETPEPTQLITSAGQYTSVRRDRLPLLKQAISPSSALATVTLLLLMTMGLPGASAALATAQKTALTNLYSATAGANWSTKTNWLIGDPCTSAWFGVTCDVTGSVVV